MQCDPPTYSTQCPAKAMPINGGDSPIREATVACYNDSMVIVKDIRKTIRDGLVRNSVTEKTTSI